MPIARLFAQFMFQRAGLLISATAIAAFASLVTTQTGSACPGPPPRPLRTLYLESDRIVVAHVGETVPMDITFINDNSYRVCLMRTALHVTSTVKGEGDQYTVYVYHQRWDLNENPEPEPQQQHEYSEYSPDDTLLIFLQRREEGEGYEVADTTYSIKKLSDADLKVYLQRIDELAAIMQQEQPDNARLVEWLVRCAEEPATRWEGAYDLASSNSALYDNNDSQASAGENQESEATDGTDATGEQPVIEAPDAARVQDGVEASEANDNAGEMANDATNQQSIELPVVAENPIAARRFTLNSPDFVQLLTAEQKDRLAALLFSAKSLDYNEVLLLELVKHWDEPRLMPFVLSYLHSVVDDPPYTAEELVKLVAEKLDDKALTALAEKYCENSSYGEDMGESRDDSDETEAQESDDEAQKDQSDSFEKALTGTNTQRRSARLRRFLASAESVAPR